MLQCKKCNKSFPNRLKMDGIWKMLSKRKYCLECSPYKRHNTRPIGEINPKWVPYGGTATCKICQREYERTRSGNRCVDQCASCRVNSRRKDLKQELITYKGGKCQICGYNRCYQVLTFHHLDPTQKEFNISGNHTSSLKRLMTEVDKCVLLCHNCHGEIHAGITVL